MSSSTTITVAAPVTAPNLHGLTVVSRSYAIGPVGTALARSATVYVPYFSNYESKRSSIYVYMADMAGEPDPSGWVPTPQELGESGEMGGTIGTIQRALAAI